MVETLRDMKTRRVLGLSYILLKLIGSGREVGIQVVVEFGQMVPGGLRMSADCSPIVVVPIFNVKDGIII